MPVTSAAGSELFEEVIDNYPYSDYATLAELRIADIHFDQENYEEALSSSTKSSSAGRTADRR